MSGRTIGENLRSRMVLMVLISCAMCQIISFLQLDIHAKPTQFRVKTEFYEICVIEPESVKKEAARLFVSLAFSQAA